MRTTLAFAFLLSGLAAPLAAQLHVETGGGQGHLDQLSPSSLTALGGGAAAAFGANRIELTGNAENRFGLGATGLATGHWFYQFTPLGWQVQLGPEATIAHDIATPWARAFSGHLVAERSIGPLAVRAEWQQGVVQAGDLSRAWYRPALGVEFHSGHWQFGTGWRSTSAADTNERFSSDSAPASQHGGYHFQEISAHVGWRAGLFSANARAGRRFGFSVQPETWWEGQAALEITPFVSLTAKTGHLASDVLLGLRGGQYSTLGLRLDLLRRAGRHDVTGAVPSGLAEVVRESASTVHLLFAMPPGTREVVLASDLTEWRPVQLSRNEDGRWETTLTAKAGVYRVNVSSNNGPWRAPPGLPVSDDGFGAKVGLLVLER